MALPQFDYDEFYADYPDPTITPAPPTSGGTGLTEIPGEGGWGSPGSGPMSPGNYTPYRPEAPSFEMGDPAQFDLGDFAVPEFRGPAPFEYPNFQGPDPSTFQTDQTYDWRRKEGLRAITNATSADGLLRSGGTLKGMMDYAGNLAGQEFGNVFNRALSTWTANRGNAAEKYQTDYRTATDEYARNYGAEADKFSRRAMAFGLNQESTESMWRRLATLYDIATRDLPTYTPSQTVYA